MDSLSNLLKTAKAILSVNDDCLLSGSLALHLQGHKLRRDPKDLDIYIPFNIPFKTLEGMVIRANEGDNDEYDDEYYERTGYRFNGIDVDVFTPISEDIPEFLDTAAGEFLSIVDFDIIKMKVHHALGHHWSAKKHQMDVIHLMASIGGKS